MGKSRPRRKRRGIVIHHDRPLLIRIIELLITLVVWLYLLGSASLLISATFSLDFAWKDTLLLAFQVREEEIQQLMKVLGIISIALVIGQVLWFRYNYQKYGKLDRRQFPKPVEAEEVAAYFSLSEEEIRYLQEESIIKMKEQPF